MADKILYPSAIDYVRVINNNAVLNAFRRRTAFVLLPSLYQRAYAVVHETGELSLVEKAPAPDESTSRERQARINIITSST